MKLSNKIALISSVGCLALIGTGFAAWTFTNTVDDSADVTAKVTCAIQAKNLKVYNGTEEIEHVYVIFDAPTTAEGNRKAGEGIFYSSTADGANKITTLKLVGQIDHVENDLHYKDSNEKVEFKVTETNNIPTEQVSFAAGSIETAEQAIVAGDNEYETNYTLPTLNYVSAPTSLEELNTFKTAVSGKTISLAFTFGIKA
jgi:hypothetical protein